MSRNLFSILLISAVLFSCGKNNAKKAVTITEPTASTTVLFDSLAHNPDAYLGKTITVSGKVVHVCTETGKKMFITGQNPDVRLYIAAGDRIAKFPMELLGSEITVEGLIMKAPAAAGTEMNSGEMKECEKKMGADCCETEKAVASQLTLADIRMEYRNHTVK
jgi:hypothetical protein